MKTFRDWIMLREDRGTRGKQGLYPPLYHQAANYPPSDVITWSADAITYMSDEDRDFKFLYDWPPKKTKGTQGAKARAD
jgi:hypothetical protein